MSRQQVRTSRSRTSQGRNHQTDRRHTYIEGNTVRKLNPMPGQPYIERESSKQRPKIDRRTRANRERALQMNPGYLLFLTLAVVMTVGVLGMYIKLQSEITSRRNHIASLERQILDVRTDNDAALNRIETSVDLQQVKDTALNSLGMVYPKEEQIVYFEVDSNDYMNQYQNIPEE